MRIRMRMRMRININPGFNFSTTRVEDPNLVQELQKAGTKYVGVRPSFLSSILWMWLLPILFFVFMGRFLGRRIGAGAEGILGFGKVSASEEKVLHRIEDAFKR